MQAAPRETASIEAAKIIVRKHVDEIKVHVTTPAINITKEQAIDTTSIKIDDSDILDLNVFVDRLETQLKQLCRAEMPATALMIEAIGLTPDAVRDFERSWAEVIEIVQTNLRGIDVICRLRQNTLCVFMPGCSLDAALERAGRMQHLLEERQAVSAPKHYPERLAIAAGCAQYNEEAGIFLQRLESALDEAQDAAPLELVVSSPTSSYFHAT